MLLRKRLQLHGWPTAQWHAVCSILLRRERKGFWKMGLGLTGCEMNGPIYSSSCTVIKSRKEPDLFYMNMKVFEIVPSAELMSQNPGIGTLNIWCAVHQVRIPNHQNKHTSS
jgi:hypothetical protein